MTKEESKKIKNMIHNIKYLNVGQKLIMYKYFLKTIIYSIIIFGYYSDITSEVVDLYLENKKVSSEENNIFSFIKKNLDKMNYDEVLDYIEMLSTLNSETIIYYLEQYDNIETACDMHSENRYIRDKKNFKTLIETKDYKLSALALTITFDNIKEFLNYDDYFWNEIIEKIQFIDSHDYKGKYGIVFDSDDIRIILPELVNLDTALISISILSEIYNKYYTHSKSDADLESEFKNYYLTKKLKKD